MVEPGHRYKYRVVALNRVGQSANSSFSTTITAASLPERLDQPRYVASTSTSITLEFDKASDNGGTPV